MVSVKLAVIETYISLQSAVFLSNILTTDIQGVSLGTLLGYTISFLTNIRKSKLGPTYTTKPSYWAKQIVICFQYPCCSLICLVCFCLECPAGHRYFVGDVSTL